MFHRFLIPTLTALLAFQSSYAMDGRAVTVVAYVKGPWYRDQAADASRMVVSKTSGSSVTSQDTILKGGRFYYPTWSFDGTRVAFYRNGHGVSIVDADGGNLRDVANTLDWGNPDQEQAIAWPATDGGKWIYYHKTGSGCFRGGTGEIWKVNVEDTTQNSRVCDYKMNDFQTDDGWGAGLWRFALSADAKYCAVHVCCRASELGYNNGIITHTFPPQGGDVANPWQTAPACASSECHQSGDCNSALSPSGELLYHFAGGHTILLANYWDHDANTITGACQYSIGTGACASLDQYSDVQAWLPGSPDVGACFVWPRGSSNSDQVVTILLGWQYGAEYVYCGNNQVIVNWKDKEAVLVTDNPEPPHSQGYVPDGTYYWYAEPGDFRLDGGPAGCYESIDGEWVDLESGATVAVERPGPAGRVHRLSATRGVVAVYDFRGARVGSFDAARLGRNGSDRLRHGIYAVVDAAGNGRNKVAMVNGGALLK